MTSSKRSSIIDWLLWCDTQDVIAARQGRLAAALLLIIEGLALLGLFMAAVLNGQPTAFVLIAAVMLSTLLLYLINRAGLTEIAGFGLATMTLALAIYLMRTTDPTGAIAISLVIPVIIAGLFGPSWSSPLIALASAAAFVSVNLLESNSFFIDLTGDANLFALTSIVMVNILFAAVMSSLFARTTRTAIRETEDLSGALNRQRERLEERLTLQTRQLQATVTVARSVAGERDLERLLNLIVQLVRDTFGYYHVQVFLVDPDGKYAVLRESTGDVGQALLARGHRLAVGSLSVIGQVTATGRSVVARDTDTDTIHRRNELLPRTRAELAIPLKVAGRVIGALDLQSVKVDAFREEDIPTLQSLADQLAVAIENARLFAQTQENLRELRELSGETTRRTWQEFLSTARDEEQRAIYGPEPAVLFEQRSQVIDRVLAAGSPLVSSGEADGLSFIAVPIVIRNQVIGVIGVEPDGPREWTRGDLNLLQGISERTALAVEKARLYNQAQRAVERERLINEIASRLQRAPSLALLLESATQELAEALGTNNVYAEINLDDPLGEREDPPQERDLAAPDETEEQARAEL